MWAPLDVVGASGRDGGRWRLRRPSASSGSPQRVCARKVAAHVALSLCEPKEGAGFNLHPLRRSHTRRRQQQRHWLSGGMQQRNRLPQSLPALIEHAIESSPAPLHFRSSPHADALRRSKRRPHAPTARADRTRRMPLRATVRRGGQPHRNGRATLCQPRSRFE
eukprot:6148540-Pleurochrysis_carterae.AAC.1